MNHRTNARVLGALALTLALAATACKTPASSAKVKNDDVVTEAVKPCPLEMKTWAGRMGMRLRDDGGAAVIDCVKVGEGLSNIGLKVGDRIVALNGGAKIDSAGGFEQTASRLAKDTAKRARQWEFRLERDGQAQTVKPKEGYPGCTLFTFEDCGPLSQ